MSRHGAAAWVRQLKQMMGAGLVVALSGGAGMAQHLGQATDDGASSLRVILALIVCVAAAIGGAFFLKHRIGVAGPLLSGRREDRRIRFIERLRVGPQQDVCIIACDGEELLMSLSPQGLSLLRALPPRVRQEADISASP